jgi:two-component system nitrate/nitrite sensor histidine kinase NarX
MQKQIIPVELAPDEDLSCNGFSWVREPEFTPPGKEEGGEVRVMRELSAPRAGELKTLLETFLENIVSTIDATAGVVRLLPPDGRMLQVVSSSGLSPKLQAAAEDCLEMDCAVGLSVAANFLIPDSAASRKNLNRLAQCDSCPFKLRIKCHLKTSDAALPPLGILTLFFDEPREITPKTIDTITAFAKVMSATIEHTQLNREARRVELLNERQGLANDIHDSLAQTLTYSRMRVSLLHEAIRSGNEEIASKYATDLDDALGTGQKSVRELIADHRFELNHSGLSTALHDIVKEFRQRYTIEIEYHNRLIDLELPLEHEIQVCRIVHEALSNIARHSGASHARVFVDERFGYFIFTIEDNGSGANTFTPVEGHYGMMIMRERAHRIGGKIKVSSAAGLGTQVQLYFPEPSFDWRAINE